ncbi:MAG TPA: uroporphyrinogen-III C-methyltransferase [Blastocatellia bacterium]|jgi:uroporphyrinogen III methyltransferase/synthase|nr:uroporphyrinogen-III C-methyltransferase [Blastocatellia bacterium]
MKLNRKRSNQKRVGKVYLVGAGPGDPGLLTLKARDLIAEADCVIYDYLVNPEVLKHARDGAELIYAGKRGLERSQQLWTQAEINRLLVAKANEHEVVVRLKGGDPFIFGRGGEEAEALVEAGIEWEVVPGVSAGSSVAAYAGIPITHRGVSSSVTFVTGHEESPVSRPGTSKSAIRWEHLANGADTLVFFMGVARIAEIADQLISNGRDADTPVAVIRWGTYGHQETVVSNLAGVAAAVERRNLTAPALIVVGEVVRLRERLQWFEEFRLTNYSSPNPFFELLAS